MSNVKYNELTALQFVLNFIDTKELLTSAMKGFAEQDSVKARDNEKICFEAIHSFLN